MKPSKLFQLKLPTPSGMSSAEWAEISPQIRDQAFFSARVEQQRIVDMLHDKLTQLIRNELDPSEFRRDMRSFLDSIGYDPDEGDVGTIKDLRTQARLELIRKINVGMARGYNQWRQFTTPAALEEFPAQRLVRRQRRNVQRDWLTRWQVAAQAVGWEGVYRGDDMVALKSSPIWVQLSRFGHPYPPFDFNSGMGTENVSIDECVKMGLLEEAQDQEIKDGEGEKFFKDSGIETSGLDRFKHDTVDGFARSFADAKHIIPETIKHERIWSSSAFFDEAKRRYVDYYRKRFGDAVRNETGVKMLEHRAEETLKEMGFSRKWKRHYARSFDGFDFAPDMKGIVVNDDVEKFDLRKTVKTGGHPPGCDTVKSILDHEFGHKIDDALRATSNPQVEALFKGSDLEKELSAYAAQAARGSGDFRSIYREAFAEAYAEYKNNPNPRPLAQKVGEWIERNMNK